MSSIDLHMQRQTEALEALCKEVITLRKEIAGGQQARGRVDTAIVRAVTNLATGLQEHADEHRRFMELLEQRHEDVMAGLVQANVAPPHRANGSGQLSATGSIPIIPEKPERGDVSASIAIGDSRIDISTEHAKLIKGSVGRWILALLGMAATAATGWLAGHVR